MPGGIPGIPKPPEPRPETPVPFGVQAATGKVRPPYEPLEGLSVKLDPKEVRERGEEHLAIVPARDGRKLSESGWGAIFAKDADPAIREALKPLLDWRKEQVGDEDLHRVFEGRKGVQPGQSAATWLANQGVGLSVVDPMNGVPFHLLLVGSPKEIPFDFQYTLDTQWSVGRICFDTPEEYATYAANTVAYEKGATLQHGRDVAMWMPANGDLATNLLCNDVGLPFHQKPLGAKLGFQLHSFLAGDATKANLGGILDGSAFGKPPALLFTGSHGLEIPLEEPDEQRALQGALVTQEWSPRQAVGENARFGGEDLPDSLKLHGMIHYLFACFGGGCPVTDNYPAPGATSRDIAREAICAKLPQTLLLRGAQAVIAHVDRAWSYSFQSGAGLPQNQLMRSVLEALMMGLPVGLASDFLNLQWGTLAAQLSLVAGPAAIGGPPPARLANLAIARDDARNYIVLGDPAARLRVDLMG